MVAREIDVTIQPVVIHEPDQPESGMRRRIEQLTVERREAAPEHVRLGQSEVTGQALEEGPVLP